MDSGDLPPARLMGTVTDAPHHFLLHHEVRDVENRVPKAFPLPRTSRRVHPL
jgi:hypothetical protein